MRLTAGTTTWGLKIAKSDYALLDESGIARCGSAFSQRILTMNTPAEDSASVRIIDVKMPFGSMIIFMVKWAIAAIPALIILVVIGALLSGLLVGISGTHHSP